MLNILSKYHRYRFTFKPSDDLVLKCEKNIPLKINGVYIIYTIINNHKMVIYIGCSGMYQKTGEIKMRGKEGMIERFTNGKQFGKQRKESWPEQMRKEYFEELTIECYDTNEDIPEIIEYHLLSEFKKEFHRLPLWNTKLQLRKILQSNFEIFKKQNNTSE